MRFPIKLLGLAGLVGALAITAVAIDRKRRQLAGGVPDVPPVRTGGDVVIVDAEIVGADALGKTVR